MEIVRGVFFENGDLASSENGFERKAEEEFGC